MNMENLMEHNAKDILLISEEKKNEIIYFSNLGSIKDIKV